MKGLFDIMMTSPSGRNPLRAHTYLVRNASKTLPLVAVIILAVMLVTGIVSLMNSIPLSVRTIYRYSKIYMGVTPRGDAELTPILKKRILTDAPVPLDRIMTVRGSDLEVKSIVGPWPFLVLALEQDDMHHYIQRMGGGVLDGRYPKPGEPEVLISEPVGRNLGKKLGDYLLTPKNAEAYSPKPVKIVGFLHSSYWISIADIDYYRQYHFPPIDSLIIFAKNEQDQRVLDTWGLNKFKGGRARIYVWSKLEENTDKMFKILYQILNVVIGTLVVVITVMMGMLINIFLTQRIQEFGLLQALGYTKMAILKRVLGETALVVMGGWALGLLTAFGLLNIVKVKLMDPSAFGIDTLDKVAYLYTIPIPVAIFTVALFTVWGRFSKFDPVGVVERRLV